MASLIRYVFGWPGPSGYGSATTAEEVATKYQDRVKGRVVFITGSNSGIGYESAKAFARVGAIVVLACRSLSNAENAAKSIREQLSQEKSIDVDALQIHPVELDLSSFASIRKGAETFLNLNLGGTSPSQLHILLNNAGVMACPKTLTADGFELQFGTNHLGHFLLTNLLSDALRRGAANNGWARVVNVASMGHFMARSIPFDDLTAEKGYEKWGRYGVSKLCNILHAVELNHRFQEDKKPEEGEGVTAYSLHPGVISTNLGRHMGSFFTSNDKLAWLTLQKTIPQGAATQVYCALAPNITAGGYYSDCNEGYRSSVSLDLELAKKLWEVSEQLTSSKLA